MEFYAEYLLHIEVSLRHRTHDLLDLSVTGPNIHMGASFFMGLKDGRDGRDNRR